MVKSGKKLPGATERPESSVQSEKTGRVDERTADKRILNKSTEDKKTLEKRTEDNVTSDKRTEDKRTEDKRTVGKRNENYRKPVETGSVLREADQKKAEKYRTAGSEADKTEPEKRAAGIRKKDKEASDMGIPVKSKQDKGGQASEIKAVDTNQTGIKEAQDNNRHRSRKASASRNHTPSGQQRNLEKKASAGRQPVKGIQNGSGEGNQRAGEMPVRQEQPGGRQEVRERPEQRGSFRGKQTARENELRRYMLLLSIPLFALILVVVILVSGKFRNPGSGQEAGSVKDGVDTITENSDISVIEPDTKVYFHDFGGSILNQDTVPEINQLMEQYFLSISEIDMETFLHLFTSEDTSEEERYRRDFEKQKQYVESYRNISCYTTKGPEADSYAAYVYYEIKYSGVETPAPSLIGPVYAVKGEDGVYRIYDLELSPELEDYMDQLSMNEDVRVLISQVDQEAEDAMAADPALNERIQYMKQGPDYMREDETVQDGSQAEEGQPAAGQPEEGQQEGGQQEGGQQEGGQQEGGLPTAGTE